MTSIFWNRRASFPHRRGANSIVRLLTLALSISLASAAVSAQDQIPNPGFENWVSGNPAGWFTNNVPPLTPVTQDSIAHSGSSAVRGEVLPFDRSNHSPEVFTAFHVLQAEAALTGWYRFAPQSNDVLEIDLTMFAADAKVGSGTLIIRNADSVYSQFTMPIVYQPGTGIPDSCYIIMYITVSPLISPVHIGSTFLVDDLAFSATTGVSIRSRERTGFNLSQNYPNPFNPLTTIRYDLAGRSRVLLTVFNTLGQPVDRLVNAEQESGHHEVRFDGSELASGLYFYRLEASESAEGEFVATRRFLLLK